MCIKHTWGGVAETMFSRNEALGSISSIPVSKTKKQTPQNKNRNHPRYIQRKKEGPHPAGARVTQHNLRALTLLHRSISLNYVLLCCSSEGSEVRLPVRTGPGLYFAFLLSSVFCFSSSCWVYWQNVSPHMTCTVSNSGTLFPVLCWVHWRPVCSLPFPQVFPGLWDSPVTVIHWNQHCSGKLPLQVLTLLQGPCSPLLCPSTWKALKSPWTILRKATKTSD